MRISLEFNITILVVDTKFISFNPKGARFRTKDARGNGNLFYFNCHSRNFSGSTFKSPNCSDKMA